MIHLNTFVDLPVPITIILDAIEITNVLKLDDLLSNIRPETMGLYDFCSDVTQLTFNDIILQSTFLFAPSLFRELHSDIKLSLILDKVLFNQFIKLKSHYGVDDDSKMIYLLFDIAKEPKNEIHPHIDYVKLSYLVKQTMGYDDSSFISCTETDHLEYFLENCILQFVMTITPVDLMRPVYRDQSKSFYKIDAMLDHYTAVKISNKIPPSYMNKNFDYEVSKRISKKYFYLKSVGLIQ